MNFIPNQPDLFVEILEQAPYGIIVCQPDGKILYANQLANFLLQKPLTGANLNSFPSIKEKLLERCTHLITGEYKALTATVKLIPETLAGSHTQPTENPQLYLQACRLRDHNYKNRILIFVEDLSARETVALSERNYTDTLEELINETSRELEVTQKRLLDKEKLATMVETAGGIAHELRQPMTAIIGTIQLLGISGRTIPDESTQRRLQTIEKQCLRMDEIIAKMEKLVSYETQKYAGGRKILDLNRSSRPTTDKKKEDN